jgi:hypothetical protein
MNNFESESEVRRKNLAEGREIGAESREKKEEEAEKRMGAMERAEKVSHEVKSTKKQMQNIVANMQQVVKAVQAIRVQLGLGSDGTQSIPSVVQDQKALDDLKKKLSKLTGQLSDLRVALVHEEGEEDRKAHGDWMGKYKKRRRKSALLKFVWITFDGYFFVVKICSLLTRKAGHLADNF